MSNALIWTTNRQDTVEVYPSEVGDGTLAKPIELGWRWRVRARNGRILEQSSEGYVRRAAAVTAAERHHPRVEDQP